MKRSIIEHKPRFKDVSESTLNYMFDLPTVPRPQPDTVWLRETAVSGPTAAETEDRRSPGAHIYADD